MPLKKWQDFIKRWMEIDPLIQDRLITSKQTIRKLFCEQQLCNSDNENLTEFSYKPTDIPKPHFVMTSTVAISNDAARFIAHGTHSVNSNVLYLNKPNFYPQRVGDIDGNLAAVWNNVDSEALESDITLKEIDPSRYEYICKHKFAIERHLINNPSEQVYISVHIESLSKIDSNHYEVFFEELYPYIVIAIPVCYLSSALKFDYDIYKVDNLDFIKPSGDSNNYVVFDSKDPQNIAGALICPPSFNESVKIKVDGFPDLDKQDKKEIWELLDKESDIHREISEINDIKSICSSHD